MGSWQADRQALPVCFPRCEGAPVGPSLAPPGHRATRVERGVPASARDAAVKPRSWVTTSACAKHKVP